MKRFTPAILFQILAFLLMGFHPAWAATYAYIPSHDNDSVVRVATSTPAFSSVTFDDPELPCSPYGAAVAPDGSYVIITCADEDVVTALTSANFTSGEAPTESQAVGVEPRGVAIDPNGVYAYVANFGSDTVSIISIATATVAATETVGDGPSGIVAIYDQSAARNKIYVTNANGNSVTVLLHDGDSVQTRTITVGTNPMGIAATPDGRFVYVANNYGGVAGSVSIIRTADHTVIQEIEDVGLGAWGVAIGAKGAYAYVSSNNANTVTIIRASDYALATLDVEAAHFGIAAPRNGDFAYAINRSLVAPITEIDTTTSPATVTPIAQDIDDPISGAYALGAFIGGTPPSAPSDLTGSVSGDDIVLEWTDASSDELGFKIERARVRDSEELVFEQIADVDANDTEYTDSQVSSGTTYQYRVRAYNEAADSDYATTSAEVTSPSSDDDDFSWCFIGTLLSK